MWVKSRPKESDYVRTHLLERKAKRKIENVATPTGDVSLYNVRAESIIVEFPLALTKISSSEKRQIIRYEAEIQAQLQVDSADAPYFGHF